MNRLPDQITALTFELKLCVPQTDGITVVAWFSKLRYDLCAQKV